MATRKGGTSGQFVRVKKTGGSFKSVRKER